MALNLSELLDLRDQLIRARAKAVTLVQINGERVQYKTDAEMASALADLDRRISAATKRPILTLKFSSSKGM
ncbi:phage head-tail joining protein [Thioclava sp. GXIMD4215]|uniref:phage head-tail joining protein n=1 Tax=Thioclava sp. GXIMD4215 TaxID=3131928 RepID=UPI00324F15D9